MSAGRDEGPIYYREIQKNAYLKRIPDDVSGSKLRPLGHKKLALKPMWTLFCVHNGRTPFLEQYLAPESTATLAHKPVWRACLRTARHVTASVKPHVGDEYDFLVDTDHGPVRMLAPDWDSMQDWVSSLRSKLHELKIMSKGENVYCAPPAAPVPRAAARDPTSPLPPTPPVPPDRVPGIELSAPSARPNPTETSDIPENAPPPNPEPETTQTEPASIDISNWDPEFDQPSTSTEKIEPSKSVTRICGQNICLDDSILRRNAATDSDEEFFAEIDRISDSVENLTFEERETSNTDIYTQRVVVNNSEKLSRQSVDDSQSDRQGTNITVIQVSNRPPHTAIPVLGPETDIFDFSFKQELTVNPENSQQNSNSFINIVNTEMNVHNSSENGYGTVFSKDDSDYGHLSLTTTVNLTGDVKVTDNEGIYERLCMASTSNSDKIERASPLPVRKLKKLEKIRKSSLPNLDVASSSESTYEYLFPNQNNNGRTTTNITLNSGSDNLSIPNGGEINSNISITNNEITSNETRSTLTNNETRSTPTNNETRSTLTNNETRNIASHENTRNFTSNDVTRNNEVIQNSSPVNVHVNVTHSVSIGGNADLNTRVIRSNVERSHSQNAYDTTPGLRDHLIRRAQNNSPKRDGKNDKTQSPQPKPIWKRGLTELSLLTRLRGIGQGKRVGSPTRQETDTNDRGVTSPGKVVHRSRPEARVDSSRRRSSSLSNGQSPPPPRSAGGGGAPSLQPLRTRQAASLRAEQRRGAAVAGSVPAAHPPLFTDYERQVWVSWWSVGGARCGGRAGDRVAALRGTPPRDAHHARQLLKTSPSHMVDILFHRVPLGKIYVLNKRDLESIGIKLDSECNITSIESQSPAGRAGLPPPGKWAVTEVNNRPINLIKGGEDEMNRLSLHGSEVSVLIQPSALVKKIRAAVKANKPLLSMR